MDLGPRDACFGVPCRIQTRIPRLLVPGHWPFPIWDLRHGNKRLENSSSLRFGQTLVIQSFV